MDSLLLISKIEVTICDVGELAGGMSVVVITALAVVGWLPVTTKVRDVLPSSGPGSLVEEAASVEMSLVVISLDGLMGRFVVSSTAVDDSVGVVESLTVD